MTIEHVETLFRKRQEEISAETCKNCIKHAPVLWKKSTGKRTELWIRK